MVSFIVGGKALIGDLISSSWSATESATPIDILDTSGSTGSVSATFKNITQPGPGSSSSAVPVPASDYLQGQPCTFSHETLGGIYGSVLNTSARSSTVSIDQSTPLSSLNINMIMPVYSEGSYFYSFNRKLPNGTVFGGVTSMAVNSNGNIWVTGNASGSNASILYDRFGNILQSLSHSFSGLGINVDSVGNIYVMGATAGVQKFNSSGASLGVIITLGVSIAQMTIDADDNIWLATADTTAGQAIKKYSSAGVFALQVGTYSPATINPGTGVFTQYTGMGAWGAAGHVNQILIGNSASDGNGSTIYTYDALSPATGANVGRQTVGTPNAEYGNFGVDWTTGSVAFPTHPIFFSQTGMYSTGHTFPDLTKSVYINTDVTAPSNTTSAIATDHKGGSYWVAVDSKIYRAAGGNLGPNQLIECYLGAAGYTGSVVYAPSLATNYADTYAEMLLVPGWDGNVWTKLKELAARTRRTITTNGTSIRIASSKSTDRATDQFKLNIADRADPPEITQGQPGAQIINATSQNTKLPDPDSFYGMLYQLKADDSLISTDAPGSSTVTVAANVHATHFDPPYAGDDGMPLAPGSFAEYAVLDSSSPALRIPAASWIAAGGQVVATPSKTSPGSVDIVASVAAPITGYVQPYSIAYLDSGGNKVPWVRLVGYGFTTAPETVKIYTGAPFDVRSELDSQTMDSVFNDTISATYDMARYSATAMAGGTTTCAVSVPVTSFAGVGFGQLSGSYFYWKRNFWRVTNAVVNGGFVDIDATVDTRISDVQDGTVTHGTIDSNWSGFRYQDNYLSPGVLVA